MRMLKLWEKAPYILKVLLTALVLVAIVRVARADGTLISLRQLNSLVRDGSTPDTPTYGLMLAGYDGTSAQFLSIGTDGVLDVDVSAGGAMDTELPAAEAMSDTAITITDSMPYLAAPMFASDGTNFVRLRNLVPADNLASPSTGYLAVTNFPMLFDGSTFDRLRGAVTNADDIAEITTNGALPTASYLYGYESVGDVWDRVRIDTSGNLFVSLGTALDSSIDSVSMAINDVIPQLDSTDRMAVSIYGFNAAAGDTQPTVTTTQASDLANTLDTLNVTSFLQGWDGTDWDRLSIFNFGDDVTLGDGTDDGLLGTMTLVMGFDEDDTNSDRIYSYDTDGDNVATEAEGVTLATTGFNRLLDEAGTYDRERVSHVAGFYTPSATPVNITVDGGEDCTSDNALTAGYYLVQTDGAVACELNADAATAGATTADMRFENPGLYTIMSTSSQDTLCCTIAAGSATVNIMSLTFN